MQEPYFICVAGGTASGKTTVCRLLAEQLKSLSSQVLILTLDNFYKELSEEELAHIEDVSFDVPSAFDVDEILECLGKLKRGSAAHIPDYSFITSARTGSHEVQPTRVIILEGILVLHWKHLRDLMHLRIFVDTPSDVRLARRILRDQKDRGRSVTSVLEVYERHVKPAYEEFIAPSKQWADIIVPFEKGNSVAISLIAEHIRARLEESGPALASSPQDSTVLRARSHSSTSMAFGVEEDQESQ